MWNNKFDERIDSVLISSALLIKALVVQQREHNLSKTIYEFSLIKGKVRSMVDWKYLTFKY